MKLLRFRARKLHAALDISIDFQSELNLIVGINGSGKTSALNCIDWLLKPNLSKLAITEFVSLELLFLHEHEIWTLFASRTDKQVKITIYKDKEELFAPLTIDIRHKGISSEEDVERYYYGLSPEPHEKPLWDFLSSLPKAVSISLDRSLAAETQEYFYVDAAPREHRKHMKKDALEEVKHLASLQHIAYQKEAMKNDDELKAKIIMAALREPNISDFHFQIPSAEDTQNLEDKVISYLQTSVKAVDIASEVRNFFRQIIGLSQSHVSRIGKDDQFTRLIISQYSRIDRLALAFNEFENNNKKSFAPLRLYLDCVNRFMQDTGKVIEFAPGSANLGFRMIGAEDKLGADRRPIGYLSSGEKQILILLTFLAFSGDQNTLFVIDEPELSLHPKWQSDFLEAILALKPPGVQVVIATHSPEIVGRRKDAVIPLRVVRS